MPSSACTYLEGKMYVLEVRRIYTFVLFRSLCGVGREEEMYEANWRLCSASLAGRLRPGLAVIERLNVRELMAASWT